MTADFSDPLPILVGEEQRVDHWPEQADAAAPNPPPLCVEAAARALEDAGDNEEVAASIDRQSVARANAESIPGVTFPFERGGNPPATLVAKLAIETGELIFSKGGGDQPQALVAENASKLFNGLIGKTNIERQHGT